MPGRRAQETKGTTRRKALSPHQGFALSGARGRNRTRVAPGPLKRHQDEGGSRTSGTHGLLRGLEGAGGQGRAPGS